MGIIVLVKRIWFLCLLLSFVWWINLKELLLICSVKRVMMSYWGLVWRQEFALTRSAWCRLVSVGMWKTKTHFSHCLLRKISKQILFWRWENIDWLSRKCLQCMPSHFILLLFFISGLSVLWICLLLFKTISNDDPHLCCF